MHINLIHYIQPAVATIGFEETSYSVTEADPQGTVMICVVLSSGIIAPGYSIDYTLDLNVGSVTQGKNTFKYLRPSPIRELNFTTDSLIKSCRVESCNTSYMCVYAVDI